MCKKLAREGFNICIVSRNEDKINTKLEEIRKECRDGDPTFMTLCITADFWQLKSIEDYRKVVAEKVEHLDVAVLALNAGFVQIGPMIDIRDDEIEKMVQVNANHVIYLAKALLD